MTELVQVAVAGSVDEAEELQALLTRAGIDATLEGAVEEHPEAQATSRCGFSCPRTSSTRRATRSRLSPSLTISSPGRRERRLYCGVNAIVVVPAKPGFSSSKTQGRDPFAYGGAAIRCVTASSAGVSSRATDDPVDAGLDGVARLAEDRDVQGALPARVDGDRRRAREVAVRQEAARAKERCVPDRSVRQAARP